MSLNFSEAEKRQGFRALVAGSRHDVVLMEALEDEQELVLEGYRRFGVDFLVGSEAEATAVALQATIRGRVDLLRFLLSVIPVQLKEQMQRDHLPFLAAGGGYLEELQFFYELEPQCLTWTFLHGRTLAHWASFPLDKFGFPSNPTAHADVLRFLNNHAGQTLTQADDLGFIPYDWARLASEYFQRWQIPEFISASQGIRYFLDSSDKMSISTDTVPFEEKKRLYHILTPSGLSSEKPLLDIAKESAHKALEAGDWEGLRLIHRHFPDAVQLDHLSNFLGMI